MILEVATLDVKPGLESAFENDFDLAVSHVEGVPGYIAHELQRSVETPNRYVLLVRWETVEAHTEEFRKSPGYQEWKKLLHHYYDPFPTVEHYAKVHEGPNEKASS
uniref:antibiotic biosynthesis monooxygenase family protein n=1 Tax=Cephaloticoccus sp. TaxID=1985742 RepID=UPI0040490018